MLRTRVTIDPPRGRVLGSAEFGDGSVDEMNDEIERETGPVAADGADEDLGHAVCALGIVPHRLGALDGRHPLLGELPGEETVGVAGDDGLDLALVVAVEGGDQRLDLRWDLRRRAGFLRGGDIRGQGGWGRDRLDVRPP